ncbi:MAG: hypothetical protein RL745_812 [Actinomycetota bacterium]
MNDTSIRVKASRLEIALVFVGIAAAMASYEFFNKTSPIGEPLIMKAWLDEQIPLVPAFVVPYLSFHPLVMVVVPLLSLRFGGRKAFLVNGIAIMVSQLCLDVAYFFFQTQIPRTKTPGNDVFGWILTHVVYGNDQPLNGFPSNHVTWTVVSMIALWRIRKSIPRAGVVLQVWFLLIIPATVLLQQHYIIDIYGGIFVAFTAYWACMFAIEKPNLEFADLRAR